MSEKSILNLLSSVAILVGHDEQTINMCASGKSSPVFMHSLKSVGRTDAYSRSTVVVNPVNLSTDEDSDPAVAPLAPGGQQVWNQQSQTCKHTCKSFCKTQFKRSFLQPLFSISVLLCF